MKLKLIFSGLLACVLLIGCSQNPCGSSKKLFLHNFSTFVDDVKSTDRKYSDSDWEDLDRTFRKFTDECYPEYEDKLSTKEQEAFFGDATAYAWQRYGKGFLNEISGNSEGFFNKLFENVDGDINIDFDSENLNEAINEVKEALDQVDTEKLEDLIKSAGEDIEDWGKKLEEAFDNKDEN